MYGRLAERFIAPVSKTGRPLGPREFETPTVRPLQLALFEGWSTENGELFVSSRQTMASTDIDAALALFESKRREYEAEIHQIDGTIAQLKRWKALETTSPSKSHQPVKRQEEGPTVTEIFLRLLEADNKPTFRLADMVERIIGSGETHAPRSTVYGNLTNYLKRNS